MKELLDYYKQCFSLVDEFHYNSEGTKSEYERALGPLKGSVLSITHSGIHDNRRIRPFSKDGLIVGFVGSETPYKGLHILREAVKLCGVELIIWGGEKKEEGNFHYRGRFSHEMLEEIYTQMDVLVVPSICRETFSLVALEALSYGTPVVVSDNVGAKDLVREYMPCCIFHSSHELSDLLHTFAVDKSILVEYNERICKSAWLNGMDIHTSSLIERFYLK